MRGSFVCWSDAQSVGSDGYFKDPTVMQVSLKVDVYSIKRSSRLHHV